MIKVSYVQKGTLVTFHAFQAHMQSKGYFIHLTFIGPCIEIYSYSTTNKMHLFLKLFILVKRSPCFGWSFGPSSGAKNCTYGNRHMSNSKSWEAHNPSNSSIFFFDAVNSELISWISSLPSDKTSFAKLVICPVSVERHTHIAACSVLSFWWWTERPSETWRAFYKNK